MSKLGGIERKIESGTLEELRSSLKDIARALSDLTFEDNWSPVKYQSLQHYDIAPYPDAGAMSSVSIAYSDYELDGNGNCHLHLDFTWTQGTATAGYVVIQLPYPAYYEYQGLTAWGIYSGSNYAPIVAIVWPRVSLMSVFPGAGGSFSIASGRRINVHGFYKVQQVTENPKRYKQ